ncbi:MAG: GNAT family N-acetyltransferase [Acidimicrobiia bacterium]|nr:GNAT family N-acetyltransferase [Acidimicrobiia bacterium]
MMETELPETLVVDELILRHPAESDRSRYLEILNRSDEIARWTTIPFPYTSSDFDSFLDNTRDNRRYVIDRDGVMIGGIGARVDREARTALFGFWLSPEARGAGIVTRAGRALCATLFDVGIERVVAEVMVGNLASGAVLDRLGFTLEGIARSVHAPRCGLDGHRIDEQIWSLLPGELTSS